MKTTDLISVLVADIRPAGAALSRKLILTVLVGAILAFIGFLIELGVRPDIGDALVTWRFNAKLAVVAAMMALGLVECIRLCRPTAKAWGMPLWGSAILLGIAALTEMVMSPSASWGARLVGSNSVICLTAIPLLSIAPLAALLYAMRSGAPAAPFVAGGMAGFAAATIAAGIYALHCTDDSPLFVAAWYSAAILIVTILGALLGRKVLRW